MKKKGSLTLSANAIVILVLAMTLLGLGVTFIRGIFTGFEEDIATVNTQIKEQLLDDLRTGNKKVSFPFTDVNMEISSEEVIALGVKNAENDPLTYSIEIRGPFTSTTAGEYKPGQENTFTKLELRWSTAASELDVKEAVVVPIQINSGTTTGNHLFKVLVNKVKKCIPNPAYVDGATFDPTSDCPDEPGGPSPGDGVFNGGNTDHVNENALITLSNYAEKEFFVNVK